ncbi:TIGR01777 family oxidoreductase [Marinicella sp. W31]|uniref:TIGR01777 family oxidoreductase n=1 Tax=Marinicella sp. W31 TaxID=3023713 RepID=UPI00375766F2
MQILITGSSGLIGSALMHKLSEEHECQGLKRTDSEISQPDWNISTKNINLQGFEADIIIHLAGENIAAKRWSEKQKKEIYDSRIQSTRLLVEHILSLSHRPQLVISASAIGYYGNRGDQTLTEDDAPGEDFVSRISIDWEYETRPLHTAGIRVVNIRSGLVLSQRGGALKKMLLPFKLGLGGRVGTGQQFYSWISIDDVVGAIEHIISTPQLQGPVNLTAPEPVRNITFTKQLAQALNRPAFFPMPAFAARLAFGEMADELLLASTRVLPGKLLNSGYTFKHKTLPQALEAVLHS